MAKRIKALCGSFVWITLVGCGGASGGSTVTSDAGTSADAPATSGDVGTDDGATSDAGALDATGDARASDAATSDATSADAADAPDPCGSAPTTDFYVDPVKGADTGASNDGAGPNCAFKTIGAALSASAGSAHDNAVIHLAAGSYGAGETFPLIVNHGRSIVGAGAATTTIAGSSMPYNTTGTGSPLDTGTNYVSIVAGDVVGGATDYGASKLSGFTLLPAAAVTAPTKGYLGIVCTAGNAPDQGAALPLPAANLLVDGVTVGPNFDVGLEATYQPTQKIACNVAVTRSTFTGANIGVITGGCGGAGNPVMSWPSAQIGDGTVPNANTFSGSVADLLGGGCGSITQIATNQFVSGYRGIVLISGAAQHFEVTGNTFDGSTATMPMGIGLQTNAGAVISKLDDNTFTNISQSSAADTAVGGVTGYAIALGGGGSVLEAHANKIHDNDNGIALGAPATAAFDFSADGTPANANKIYCNSKKGSTSFGYDLILSYTGGVSVNFAGNQWDHATPTTGASLIASANGTDYVTGTSAGATLTGAVSVGGVTCATGRVQ
jgi:hypothetical protein